MDTKKHVGKRLRQLRLQNGMSQEVLSRNTGIDRTYISDVENGRRNISIETLAVLLKGLKISFQGFFDFKPFQKVPQNPKGD